MSIVFSTNQPPRPGIQDSIEISEDVIIETNTGKIDTANASDSVIIREKNNNIGNDDLEYYIDENGIKHYIITANDVASGTRG